MLNPSDINKINNSSKDQKRSIEKKIQDSDLNYLSSIAFEQFKVSHSDINKLNQLIDKKSKGSSGSFHTIYISVLCGLLIGVSVFFVVFQKNKNHPSHFQSTEKELYERKLANSISATDTIFPILETKTIEHYNTIANNVNEIETPEILETLPSKALSLNIPEKEDDEDIVFQFTANAPVVFIHNLKITNYRLYYFKHSEAINLTANSGLSAQYNSNADIEKTYTNRSNAYFAHKIIKQAMRLFNSKNTTNCIEELTLLYDFNNDDANAQFYLGMCYYQLGKYTIAQTYFQKNLDNVNNIFHQESEFYQALCLLSTKQTEDAIKQLQTIVHNKGFYHERAKEILAKQSK